MKKTLTTLAAAALTAGLLAPLPAAAHCNRMNGPVVQSAEQALETGDFSKVAIWVAKEQADELRQKFEQSLAVYKTGGDARDLAQNYFYSNTVRLHRLSEGMSYEGLEPAQPLPRQLALAEESLDTTDPKAVISYLSDQMAQKVEDLHQQVIEAARTKDESVEAGRAWADAYVRYIVFVNSLDGAIAAGPAHGVGD